MSKYHRHDYRRWRSIASTCQRIQQLHFYLNILSCSHWFNRPKSFCPKVNIQKIRGCALNCRWHQLKFPCVVWTSKCLTILLNEWEYRKITDYVGIGYAISHYRSEAVELQGGENEMSAIRIRKETRQNRKYTFFKKNMSYAFSFFFKSQNMRFTWQECAVKSMK